MKKFQLFSFALFNLILSNNVLAYEIKVYNRLDRNTHFIATLISADKGECVKLHPTTSKRVNYNESVVFNQNIPEDGYCLEANKHFETSVFGPFYASKCSISVEYIKNGDGIFTSNC